MAERTSRARRQHRSAILHFTSPNTSSAHRTPRRSCHIPSSPDNLPYPQRKQQLPRRRPCRLCCRRTDHASTTTATKPPQHLLPRRDPRAPPRKQQSQQRRQRRTLRLLRLRRPQWPGPRPHAGEPLAGCERNVEFHEYIPTSRKPLMATTAGLANDGTRTWTWLLPRPRPRRLERTRRQPACWTGRWRHGIPKQLDLQRSWKIDESIQRSGDGAECKPGLCVTGECRESREEEGAEWGGYG